jgi:putative ABC transport system permease protein
VAGVVLGNVLARPLLAHAAYAYGVGVLGVPAWVDADVAVAMCGLTGIAALAPAVRAARLSTVAAIAAGRAPRQDRGYAAHRLLGRLRLPRPVTIGLAAPFARPARTAVTLAAVLLGALAVTFAVGLDTSLQRVHEGMDLTGTVQVRVFSVTACGAPGPNGEPEPSGPQGPPSSQQITPRQQSTIQAAIRSQPGTLHYAAEVDTEVAVAGLAQQVQVTAFRGDASWTGYPMISGRWYAGPDQADVPTGFLVATGTTVGDWVTISYAGRQIPVRIVGEIFAPANHGLSLITDWQTLASADPGLAPSQYAIGLRAGTSAVSYAAALRARLGPGYATLLTGVSSAIVRMLWLIGSLTLLLAIAAALGVLNTTVLQTRERTHDLGVFKALGMTPRQAVTMTVCSAAAIGLSAGLIAVPAGILLHHYVLPRIAAAAGTGLPASFLDVYGGLEITGLVLAGLLIAVAGALLPAAWAARIPAISALRTE